MTYNNVMGTKSIPTNVAMGVAYGLYYSRLHLFHSYVLVPLGIVVLLVILYGFNQLLTNVFKITFPASVLGMLINLVVLCLLNGMAQLLGPTGSVSQRVGSASLATLTRYLTVIKPSMNFSLKWINVFFIPSFIILPLSDPITFVECAKIAAVFVVGFLALFVLDVYLIWALKLALAALHWLPDQAAGTDKEEQDELHDEFELELENMPSRGVFTSMRDDITTIDLTSILSVPSDRHKRQVRTLTVDENPFRTQETSVVASEAATDAPPGTSMTTSDSVVSVAESVLQPAPLHTKSGPEIHHPRPLSHPSGKPPHNSASSVQDSALTGSLANSNTDPFQHLCPMSRRVTVLVTNYIDWFVYLLLLVVALPFYYVRSIHVFLPYHLGLTVLAYYLALLIPQRWPRLKKVAHPILVLTAEILFCCFVGSLIYHKGNPRGFLDDLEYYKTGKNYLNLFNNKVLVDNGRAHKMPNHDFTATPKWPGCGDVLSSLMDISIVSLSLPMFTHRGDFVRNFWVLVPPILASIALTFILYPIVTYHIGIQPTRAIGFIGRSVTLALGTPLIQALEGSVSLMAVCTILSGICGVLIGDTFFRILRVPQGDFVTRGVTMGINCGAIATAHLLNDDPRAALMSSLSFSLFGTVMVIMAAIGAVKQFVNLLVGL